jgi:hypothetical protein
VDWLGWAVFGLMATGLFTGLMSLAQVFGRTRMDLPLLLGTVFAADPDKARALGFVIHLLSGQVFALGYAAGFAALGHAGVLLGAAFGGLHALVALTVLVPSLPALHPRMASDRAGPSAGAVLEPPGALALNYGRQTVLVAVAAHVAYGALLGVLLSPG